jgi:hypothetical protein
MGLTESKLILQKVQNACDEAERQGSFQLEEVLRDKEVSVWPGDTRKRLKDARLFNISRLVGHIFPKILNGSSLETVSLKMYSSQLPESRLKI